jgi:hypothetical protein
MEYRGEERRGEERRGEERRGEERDSSSPNQTHSAPIRKFSNRQPEKEFYSLRFLWTSY